MIASEEPAEESEERSVRRSELEALRLPPDDRELVAEHEDLEVLVDIGLAPQDHEAEEAAYHYIKEEEGHGAGVCQGSAGHVANLLLTRSNWGFRTLRGRTIDPICLATTESS